MASPLHNKPFTSGSCPSEASLAEYLEQRLSPEEADPIRAHAAQCDRCGMTVAMLGGTEESDGATPIDTSLGAFVERTELAQAFAVGAVVSHYRILHKVGQGAMGIVYAAHDLQLERRVALKVLLDDRSEAEWSDALSAGGRLLREARSMARLVHPNIATVFEVGIANRHLFLAMQLVDGTTLADWLATSPRRDRVLSLFVEAARAVGAAHRAGVVHRDLKPHNILVSKDGVPIVTDFGIAATTDDAPLPADDASAVSLSMLSTLHRTRHLAGTPAYMAPEVLHGSRATAASDQFSFAVCIHEALSGRRPYEADTLDALKEHAARAAPRIDSSIPAALKPVLVRALAVHPAARYASMGALADALEAASARRPSKRGLFLVGGLVVLAVLALFTRTGSSGRATVATATEPPMPSAIVSSAPSVSAAAATVAPTPSATVKNPPPEAPAVKGVRRVPSAATSDWLRARK
jgi:eukaryotic-like serine/threonine-protein kinase